MKICLLGYGKMGHEIEIAGIERGHEFPLIIDENNPGDLSAKGLQTVDAVIDFSSSKSAPDQILFSLNAGVPVISGTTGWNERMDEIMNICLKVKGAFFYASNYSIGVNIFFNLNRHLAKIMNSFPEYSPSVKEIHHIHKLDAPSGTAITLAEQIIKLHHQFSDWSMENAQPDILPIKAIREGEENGFHEITYTSEIDNIVISHNAKSRKGFAAGAIMAAEFIQGKTGIFGMDDLLKL